MLRPSQRRLAKGTGVGLSEQLVGARHEARIYPHRPGAAVPVLQRLAVERLARQRRASRHRRGHSGPFMQPVCGRISWLAELRDGGGLVAVQCKFYAEGKRIYKADIDSFLASVNDRRFESGIVVSATGDWSGNAGHWGFRPSPD